jgi:hypothetical protein
MKPKNIIPFILLIGLLEQSCGPKEGCDDHESKNTYYKINEATKSKIPFSGTDTLVYISMDGDTATLIGQGKKSYTEKVAVKLSTDPSCPAYDYDYFEHIEFSHMGNSLGLGKIFVDITATIDPFFMFSDANIDIGDSHSKAPLETISDARNYNVEVIIDSISISGVKISINPNNFCIYNYQYGILQIVSEGKSWKRYL